MSGSNLRFAAPSDSAKWPERMEAACQEFERIFGIHLHQAYTGTKLNPTVTVISDRAKYFRSRLKTKSRPFSLFTGSGYIMGGDLINDGYFALGGSNYPFDDRYTLTAIYPTQEIAKHEEILVRLGDALQARSAEFTPSPVARRLRLAHWRSPFGGSASAVETLTDMTIEEECLPLIRESYYEGLDPLQPHNFGWINYWSEDVCTYLDFPNQAKGLPMHDISYRTPNGAWLVKLSRKPFEIGNMHYVKILTDAYAAFPRVGRRFSSQPSPRGAG